LRYAEISDSSRSALPYSSHKCTTLDIPCWTPGLPCCTLGLPCCTLGLPCCTPRLPCCTPRLPCCTTLTLLHTTPTLLHTRATGTMCRLLWSCQVPETQRNRHRYYVSPAMVLSSPRDTEKQTQVLRIACYGFIKSQRHRETDTGTMCRLLWSCQVPETQRNRHRYYVSSAMVLSSPRDTEKQTQVLCVACCGPIKSQRHRETDTGAMCRLLWSYQVPETQRNRHRCYVSPAMVLSSPRDTEKQTQVLCVACYGPVKFQRHRETDTGTTYRLLWSCQVPQTQRN